MKKIIMRPAAIGDAVQIGQVHSITANAAYRARGLLPPEMLDALFIPARLEGVAEKNINDSIRDPNGHRLSVALSAPHEIVGFAQSCIATNKDDGHLLPHFAKIGINDFDAAPIVQFKTIYILPAFQHAGLGTRFLLDAALSEMAEKSDMVFTETLHGYAISPKFFQKFGARHIAEYETTVGAHYVMPGRDETENIRSNIYVMKKVKLLIHAMKKKEILNHAK